MTTETTPFEKIVRPARGSFFNNLPIGMKLLVGFGILVFLTFVSAGVSYLGSALATEKIERTDDVRVPTALMASRAQADLLRMQADVRGYLALGDPAYREQYHLSSQAFEADLVELEKLSPNLDAANAARLKELKTTYEQWAVLPDQLFELRDDQLDREPAYRLLATEGIRYAGQVLIATNTLIETQGQRDPTADNLELLEDMAKFQGNFAAMLSALRGYVTTRNRIYRGEYEVNLTANMNSWERVSAARNKMNSSQQELLDKVAENREAFLALPEQIFATLESERWREDLYLFQTEAIPLAETMSQVLDGMTSDQQSMLTSELAAGRQDLTTANKLILAGGFVALLFGLLLTWVSRATIAGPIQRLTGVAERIRSGDLDAQANVESKDETGLLATTFNNMTTKLRDTLKQVRKEKKRADDLLEVVIPIGVDLTTERDFNRLLEKMLLEAKAFCHADAGVLFLRGEDNHLRFTIVHNTSNQIQLGGTSGTEVPFLPLPLHDPETGKPNHSHVAAHVALDGNTVNIAGPVEAGNFDLVLRRDDPHPVLRNYEVKSLLGLPLKNSLGQVLGVLQLINSQDPDSGEIVAFDQNLQQMMESFSSLAVAALEAYIREQVLRKEINRLRIEIDEAKQKKQVEEIVGTDFFQHISSRAQELRQRRRGDE